MNEFVKLLVWQMAQVLGYEGQIDLAEHALLLLVDYDADTCHPVFIGRHFVVESLDPESSWNEIVSRLISEAIDEEYKQEVRIFFSEKAARRKFEKQRYYDSINYISRLSNGKKWTHCIQSLFSSDLSLQDIAASFRTDTVLMRSPGIIYPEYNPSVPTVAPIFSSQGSADRKNHLISYYLVIEIDAIRKSIESLRYLARHDQLTGLYNRHMMSETVTDDPSVVIILDIDNFKGINDTYGHTAGDEALCTIAGRLEAVFWRRERDLVFRLGGDEFLVVMKGASEEDAVSCLKQLCEPLCFTTKENQTITITVSAGYAICDGDYKDSMKAADAALYYAKGSGKSGFSRAE